MLVRISWGYDGYGEWKHGKDYEDPTVIDAIRQFLEVEHPNEHHLEVYTPAKKPA